VVFKMLESAPDSVSDEVWFRVVQVVTGFDDGMPESEREGLQKHAAGKAFQNLATQRVNNVHETLVKLGAYLIGEFGHLLRDNITAKAQYECIQRHYARGGSQTKHIILLAVAKLFSSNADTLRQSALPWLEDLQESHDAELQQRACECLRVLMQSPPDLVDSVFGGMPVYAESAQVNNPLMQRLKFQSKSRAHTRAHLEEAAKSEGGMFKSGNLRGVRSPRSGELAPSPGGASIGSAGRAIGGPGAGGAESDSSGSGSDDEAPAGGAATNGAPAPGSGALRDLWQQVCIMPQGRLYSSASLNLDVKQEYNGAAGRLTVMFTNPGQSPIGNIRVMLPETPHVQMQPASEPPPTLGPGQQAPHLLQVRCMRPFLQPAKYLIEYCDRPGGAPIQVPLMLPCVMTKFITPVEMQLPQFRQYFESFAGPPRESLVIAQAKVNPAQWPNYLTKGFNLGLVAGSDPSNAMAVGTFNTATADPSKPGQMMTVPCMLRLEYNQQGNMVRTTVRTQHGEVTQALAQIVATYLLVPPSA